MKIIVDMMGGDNAPLAVLEGAAAAVNRGSKALLFTKYRALLVQRGPDRHASGSPFGRAVTEGD